MKKRILLISLLSLLAVQSCKKDPENIWKIEVKKSVEKIQITDISKEFFDPNFPLEQFKTQYPWFQGTVTDEDYAKRRLDPLEVKIYKEAIAKIDVNKLSTELADLFAHVQHYFPQFKNPKVYLFSSSLQMAEEPILYQPQENLLFIDITGFMGENNTNYKGVVENYFQKSMNPQNIVPKVSLAFAQNAVRIDGDQQKFIDELIYSGKIMMLQDAFLPETPEYLKLNYTQKQYDWAIQNEANVWNYFVESNLLFSSDARLVGRFIAPGPFSKFYTEIDNESSPQIGVFTGYKICKKYFAENPETKLLDFLKMSGTDIFNKSDYKPKQP